jgi:mevalonate kinase
MCLKNFVRLSSGFAEQGDWVSSLVLSVPGKSFLAGEYLALKGGPSLVFTSKPRFELIARLAKSGRGQVEGIHPESPAGQLICDHRDFFSEYDLRFLDPHQGRGGWGASTAQVLMAFVLNEWRSSCELETLKSLSISRLLESYWKYAWNGQGHRPSGADLVAQYKGSLCLFEKRTGLLGIYGWTFSDIDFALIPTGKKLPTHEHLKTLGEFKEESLETAMKAIQRALQNRDSQEFVAGIQANAASLAELGFVAPHTQLLCQELLQKPGVLAAKGCGALGADVVLVIYEKTYSEAFKNFVTSKDITQGLEIQVKE